MVTIGRERSTLLAFVTLIAVITLIPGVFGADQDQFSASATVGNEGPVVDVPSGQSWLGQAGQAANRQVFFNVTDTNGATDINGSTITLVLINGTTLRATSGCLNISIDANTLQFNCTVSLNYYDDPGNWVINATIEDNQGNFTENSSVTGQVLSLDAVAVTVASLSFSGSPGSSDNAAAENPQRLNNTGNQIYTSINITGFEFASATDDMIGVGNVTVNITDESGAGQILVNNTRITVDAATLTRGAGENRPFYFWLDVPAAQPSGTYNAISDWEVVAIQ